jgi:hypothetical protein
MRRILVPLLALVVSGSAVAANSTHASLRVGVEVTRTCSIAAGRSGTLDVRCTRAGAASVQTSVDGRRPASLPLVTLGPGVKGAVVPLGAPDASAAPVVTILF